jgi:hypothetical protein
MRPLACNSHNDGLQNDVKFLLESSQSEDIQQFELLITCNLHSEF